MDANVLLLIKMNLEKFLYKKIPIWILLLTIILSVIIAILFASAAIRSKNVYKIAKTPEVIKNFFSGYYDPGLNTERFDNKKGFNFNLKISSKYPYLLLSRYDGDLKQSVVELVDLQEKKIIHKWIPNLKKLNNISKNKQINDLRKDHKLTRYVISHPFMFPNGDLLIHGQWTPVTKINLCSNIIWSLDYAFHHSLEKDNDNNFWIPFTIVPNSISAGLNNKIGPIHKHFIDDGIMKISSEGKVLFKKSVMEIFIENNLEKLIFPGQPSYDPIHLNDNQPVLYDSNNFKKGDVFLSLRSISIIVLYRPATNKIIWYKKNPWENQHDVDILNNQQISIFNNKNKIMFTKGQNIYRGNNIKNNNLLIYDFEKDKVLNNYENLFNKYNIQTPTQGLAEIMKDGSVFIEESDYGRLLYFSSDKELIFEYINRNSEGKIYPLKWFRIVNNIDKSFLHKISNDTCDEN